MELYAFWKYDLYPYILGGEIVSQGKDDGFYIKGYGNYQMIPNKIVSLKKGREFHKKLETLTRERKTKLDDIRREYESKRLELLKEYDF